MDINNPPISDYINKYYKHGNFCEKQIEKPLWCELPDKLANSPTPTYQSIVNIELAGDTGVSGASGTIETYSAA